MGVLAYNGITLPYTNSTQFYQEAISDESDTDWIETKFDIRAQGLINLNYLSLLAPDLVGASATLAGPAGIMNMIRSRLMRRRRDLSYRQNGVELIPRAQEGITGTVDARNGPVPKYCNLVQLNNTTFLIDYRITAHYWEFKPDTVSSSSDVTANRQGNNVLCNRWTESVDIDNLMMSTRTRQGKFRIRSDNVDAFEADQIRSAMAVVGVPDGFLRQSSSYTVSPDGLNLSYRITDKETFKMPPEPAYQAEGTYTQTATMLVQWRVGACEIRLKGAKTTPQENLIKAAVSIALQKCNQNRIAGANWIESATLTMGLYENTVSFSMRMILGADKSRWKKAPDPGVLGEAGIAAFTNISTETPTPKNFNVGGTGPLPGGTFTSTTGSYKPSYLDRGTAGLLLQAAAYWDPSVRLTSLSSDTGQHNTGFRIGTAGQIQETNV